MQKHYLSRPDGTGKVYFDVPPEPVPTPAPMRRGSVKKMLNGWDPALERPIPGAVLVYDGGYGAGDCTMEFTTELATGTTMEAIRTLSLEAATLYYSPNDGGTIWEVAWQPGQSFLPQRHPQIATPAYHISLKFNVIAQIS